MDQIATALIQINIAKKSVMKFPVITAVTEEWRDRCNYRPFAYQCNGWNRSKYFIRT
jgi:hypothetical protein